MRQLEKPVAVESHCAAHGPFTAMRWGNRPPACPTCRDEIVQQEKAEHEASMRRFRRDGRRLECGLLGTRFGDATFETFVADTPAQRRVLEGCRAFATELRGSLWLLGRCGCGKTHLAAAIVMAAIDADRSAHLITARALVKQIRATWSRDASETENDVVARYGRCGLLAIDEVGVGEVSEADRTQLLDVIDMRYQRCLPTVIATNLNAELLRAAVGERIYDRLREQSTVLVLAWASHRATE